MDLYIFFVSFFFTLSSLCIYYYVLLLFPLLFSTTDIYFPFVLFDRFFLKSESFFGRVTD